MWLVLIVLYPKSINFSKTYSIKYQPVSYIICWIEQNICQNGLKLSDTFEVSAPGTIYLPAKRSRYDTSHDKLCWISALVFDLLNDLILELSSWIKCYNGSVDSAQWFYVTLIHLMSLKKKEFTVECRKFFGDRAVGQLSNCTI